MKKKKNYTVVKLEVLFYLAFSALVVTMKKRKKKAKIMSEAGIEPGTFPVEDGVLNH